MMKKEKITMLYRNGDVVIQKINELPQNVKEIEIKPLALGEITGHSHRVVADKLKMYEDENGRLYFKLDSVGSVVHEEHKTITLEPGIYTTKIIREYDYAAETLRKVQD